MKQKWDLIIEPGRSECQGRSRPVGSDGIGRCNRRHSLQGSTQQFLLHGLGLPPLRPCYFLPMRPGLLLLMSLLITSCAAPVENKAEHQQWLDVLAAKKRYLEAQGPEADRLKQEYVNELTRFVRGYPSHGRAREVYEQIALEFADQLMSQGRYDDAARFYRGILSRSPARVQAREKLARATDQISVSDADLGRLRLGMTRGQVTAVLGPPSPGWTRSIRKGRTLFESWYYRRDAGRIAGVHFSDGKVFAAE